MHVKKFDCEQIIEFDPNIVHKLLLLLLYDHTALIDHFDGDMNSLDLNSTQRDINIFTRFYCCTIKSVNA